MEYFVKRIIPVAEEVGVKMAMHPDDPPWEVFGLPRIIRDQHSMERLIQLVDSPSNGLTFCSGSLGADKRNNLEEIVRYFIKKQRVHFMHLRNLKRVSDKHFIETAHPSECGSLDIYRIVKAAVEAGYDGPVRPDHGRMIWGETGRPGYGLYDRALGVAYLNGLIESVKKR